MSRLAMNSLAFIATCIAVAGPAGAATPQPPHPLGNPGNWANSEDYPPGPLRRAEEGVTGFTLTIRPDGTVSGCEITKSSGSDDLDQTTCTLITERARFEAATDDHGRKVAGTWSSSIRWQIPEGDPLPQPIDVVISMLVDKNGKATDCRIERAVGQVPEGTIVGPTVDCPISTASAPYRDEKGNPVARRVRITTKVEVLPVTAPAPAGKSKP
jgi:protein TonB